MKPNRTPSVSVHVASALGSLDKSPVTGADGRVEFDLPAGIDMSVWAIGDDDKAGTTTVDVPALDLMSGVTSWSTSRGEQMPTSWER